MTDHSSCFLQVGTHSASQAFLILSGLPALLLLFFTKEETEVPGLLNGQV